LYYQGRSAGWGDGNPLSFLNVESVLVVHNLSMDRLAQHSAQIEEREAHELHGETRHCVPDEVQLVLEHVHPVTRLEESLQSPREGIEQMEG
jgi:hypothetical protein